MNPQVPNIHVGICGLCGGNVTHQMLTLPRCEQCGAETVSGPVLPMVPPAGAPPVYDAPPLVRDSHGRFRKPGEEK